MEKFKGNKDTNKCRYLEKITGVMTQRRFRAHEATRLSKKKGVWGSFKQVRA